MLVHLVEPTLLKDADGWDYDNFQILGTMKIDSYDTFMKFIAQYKDEGLEKFIEYRGKWYTLLEYCFVFPQGSDYVPLLRLYVTEY